MSSFLPSLQTFVKATLASAVGFSTLVVGILYYGQNSLIYQSAHPPGSRTDVSTPAEIGLTYEDLTLLTPDGVNIHCFLLLQRPALPVGTHIRADPAETHEQFAARRPTVVMFHGNAGNLGHRLPLAQVFYLRMRCNVLMVSYRGYGRSEGSPSEKGLRIDAQTALDHLSAHATLGPALRVILYGQSIGGAVAIDLAARNPHAVAGLVVENTFLSMPRLIPTVLPILAPFAFLCHQKWDNARAIRRIPASVALLMLSGKRDEVVPAAHMSELWEIVREQRAGKNATWAEFAGGAHNDTCAQQGYWAAVAEFVAGVA